MLLEGIRRFPLTAQLILPRPTFPSGLNASLQISLGSFASLALNPLLPLALFTFKAVLPVALLSRNRELLRLLPLRPIGGLASKTIRAFAFITGRFALGEQLSLGSRSQLAIDRLLSAELLSTLLAHLFAKLANRKHRGGRTGIEDAEGHPSDRRNRCARRGLRLRRGWRLKKSGRGLSRSLERRNEPAS